MMNASASRNTENLRGVEAVVSVDEGDADPDPARSPAAPGLDDRVDGLAEALTGFVRGAGHWG